MNYNDVQLREIKENLSLININAIKILEVIDNEGNLNHNNIPEKAEMSKFVTDKCISAFLVSGLISRIDDGVKRYYKLTDDGKALLSL